MLEAACGVDDPFRQKRGNPFQNGELCFVQRFQPLFAEAPAGVSAPTQHTRVGTGDVSQNGVGPAAVWEKRGKRRRIGGVADGDGNPVRETAAGDVLAKRRKAVLVKVGGDDTPRLAD